ncbi:hypothetical protein CSUI_004849 [Cystoisospora suis]|uniref:Uncharacterized protein n=1 Tax=Cystoisospora suis TaxID=483139 RepID=A0A2C6L010_9APIC|nr:hypothetical protein CSUI_004849 [Cystoisospora suis]
MNAGKETNVQSLWKTRRKLTEWRTYGFVLAWDSDVDGSKLGVSLVIWR